MVDYEFVMTSMESFCSRSDTFFGILRCESDYDNTGILHLISAFGGLSDGMAFVRPSIIQHIYEARHGSGYISGLALYRRHFHLAASYLRHGGLPLLFNTQGSGMCMGFAL